MKKRIKWSIAALVIFMIGGIMIFSLNQQKEKTLEEQMRHEQERMVKYLAQNYKDIGKVEFTEINHNTMTGTYNFDATVNDKIEVRFVLRGLNGDIYMNELYSRNFGNRLIKLNESVNSPDITHIKIVYKGE